jgi:hypothetical protein
VVAVVVVVVVVDRSGQDGNEEPQVPTCAALRRCATMEAAVMSWIE